MYAFTFERPSSLADAQRAAQGANAKVLAGGQTLLASMKLRLASPEQLVDGCLDLLGPVEVSSETRQELVAQAKEWGQTGWASETSAKTADKRVGEMLQLIVATREYQFA